MTSTSLNRDESETEIIPTPISVAISEAVLTIHFIADWHLAQAIIVSLASKPATLENVLRSTDAIYDRASLIIINKLIDHDRRLLNQSEPHQGSTQKLSDLSGSHDYTQGMTTDTTTTAILDHSDFTYQQIS